MPKVSGIPYGKNIELACFRYTTETGEEEARLVPISTTRDDLPQDENLKKAILEDLEAIQKELLRLDVDSNFHDHVDDPPPRLVFHAVAIELVEKAAVARIESTHPDLQAEEWWLPAPSQQEITPSPKVAKLASWEEEPPPVRIKAPVTESPKEQPSPQSDIDEEAPEGEIWQGDEAPPVRGTSTPRSGPPTIAAPREPGGHAPKTSVGHEKKRIAKGGKKFGAVLEDVILQMTYPTEQRYPITFSFLTSEGERGVTNPKMPELKKNLEKDLRNKLGECINPPPPESTEFPERIILEPRDAIKADVTKLNELLDTCREMGERYTTDKPTFSLGNQNLKLQIKLPKVRTSIDPITFSFQIDAVTPAFADDQAVLKVKKDIEERLKKEFGEQVSFQSSSTSLTITPIATTMPEQRGKIWDTCFEFGKYYEDSLKLDTILKKSDVEIPTEPAAAPPKHVAKLEVEDFLQQKIGRILAHYDDSKHVGKAKAELYKYLVRKAPPKDQGAIGEKIEIILATYDDSTHIGNVRKQLCKELADALKPYISFKDKGGHRAF